MSNHKSPNDSSQVKSTIETLTDRQLLGLFVRGLRGCDFIYDVENAVSNEPEMIGEYALLETALAEANRRITNAAGGGE